MCILIVLCTILSVDAYVAPEVLELAEYTRNVVNCLGGHSLRNSSRTRET